MKKRIFLLLTNKEELCQVLSGACLFKNFQMCVLHNVTLWHFDTSIPHCNNINKTDKMEKQNSSPLIKVKSFEETLMLTYLFAASTKAFSSGEEA